VNLPIETGAIKVQKIELVSDDWTGVRVDIGEGSNFHRQFDIVASPKGAKFDIIPQIRLWRALSILLPDGSDLRVSFWDGQWHVAGYDPDSRYIGSIDQPETKE
jgi:hypothetical protein